MIEAFRQRGIRPTAVGSLAVPSLLLESEDLTKASPDSVLADIVSKLLNFGARQLGRNAAPAKPTTTQRKRRSSKRLLTFKEFVAQQNQTLDPADVPEAPAPAAITSPATSEDEEPETILREVAVALTNWAKDHRAALKLDPSLKVALRSFHPVHRIASGGELLVEMVAHFVQTPTSSEDLGGLKCRIGVTMIANIEGYVRYVIQKPVHEKRTGDLRAWVKEFDEANGMGWATTDLGSNRMAEAFSARAMDRRRWR